MRNFLKRSYNGLFELILVNCKLNLEENIVKNPAYCNDFCMKSLYLICFCIALILIVILFKNRRRRMKSAKISSAFKDYKFMAKIEPKLEEIKNFTHQITISGEELRRLLNSNESIEKQKAIFNLYLQCNQKREMIKQLLEEFNEEEYFSRFSQPKDILELSLKAIDNFEQNFIRIAVSISNYSKTS